MSTDPIELELSRKRKERTVEQIKQYEAHLDQLEAEKTGVIAGKKAKIVSNKEAPIRDLFSKIIKTP